MNIIERRMNQMKAERQGKSPHTENINTRVPPRCCEHRMFADVDVPDPIHMFRGKYYAEKFVEYIEDKLKRFQSW